jgi:superfamily II DNA helicase RecQ
MTPGAYRRRFQVPPLPPGFGKSLIYQVPAMIFERPTIVISPLIALMADQERALRGCGVPVVVCRHPLAQRAPNRSGACAAPAEQNRTGVGCKGSI